MRCCARTLASRFALRLTRRSARRLTRRFAAVLLAGAPALAVAQGSAVPTEPEPGTLVTEAIAARWGVAADRIALEWDAAQAPAGIRSFRLAGSGADGTWLVTFVSDTVTKAFVVRAGIEVDERVAARDLERGRTLESADIGVERAVRWGAPERDAPQPMPGWQTQRRIRAGEALRAPAVAPPLAVRSGDEVHIEVVRGMVSVTTTARAAGSARVGEAVQVRTGFGNRLNGVVIAPGRVRIGGSLEES